MRGSSISIFLFPRQTEKLSDWCYSFRDFVFIVVPALVIGDDELGTNSKSDSIQYICIFKFTTGNCWFKYSAWECNMHPIFPWQLFASWVVRTKALFLVNHDWILSLRLMTAKVVLDFIFTNPLLLYRSACTTAQEKDCLIESPVRDILIDLVTGFWPGYSQFSIKILV